MAKSTIANRTSNSLIAGPHAFTGSAVVITEDPSCREIVYMLSSANANVNEDGSFVVPADVTEFYVGQFMDSYLIQQFGGVAPAVPITHMSFEEGSLLTKVGWYSFVGSDLISIEFPASLMEVGRADFLKGESEVFPNSLNLASVTFPCGSMTKVHYNAFRETDGVVIYMPHTVEYFGIYGTVVILDCPLTAAPSEAPSEAAVDAGLHIKCGTGTYIKNKCKGHDFESCEKCQLGKFNNNAEAKNKRCKKCPENSYQNEKGAAECKKCPPDFHTRNQRGKRQCFEKSSGKSMEKLGHFN